MAKIDHLGIAVILREAVDVVLECKECAGRGHSALAHPTAEEFADALRAGDELVRSDQACSCSWIVAFTPRA